MDKLKLQTVYVPADQRNNTFQGLERIHKGGIGYMHKQDNRIVLTPGELLQFTREAVQASGTMSPEQFLKSKGVGV